MSRKRNGNKQKGTKPDANVDKKPRTIPRKGDYSERHAGRRALKRKQAKAHQVIRDSLPSKAGSATRRSYAQTETSSFVSDDA